MIYDPIILCSGNKKFRKRKDEKFSQSTLTFLGQQSVVHGNTPLEMTHASVTNITLPVSDILREAANIRKLIRCNDYIAYRV
jgi:hypothetical protein